MLLTPLRPLVLFAKGNATLLNDSRPAITIVGSRNHSPYGEAASKDFAHALARAGVILWSGLAYGIDSLAHKAALTAGTPTVAVLAGGLDRIYPAQHAYMADRIVAEGGLLLAETPPGMRPTRGHFPRRNRILAAAAQAVLVIEAGIASGSLHTARFAADVGTPVFALPGPYTSIRSLGCHSLIADGAQIAVSPEDLLRRLGIERDLHGTESSVDTPQLECSADETAILKLLQGGPRPCDLVAREARMPEQRYLQALLNLQGSGAVLGLPGDLLALGRSNT